MGFVEKQLVPVQFGGGVNTKVDPKQLQAGQLLTLQNGVFGKAGLISKRSGFDLLSNQIEGGGTITAGVELAVYKNELVLFDGTNVYSWLSATSTWANRGTAISIITEDKDIQRTSQAEQLNPDMAYANGIEVYAWEDSRGGVYYSVLDTNTKAFAVSGVQLNASAQQPKCVTFGGVIYIFYLVATTLYYQVVGPANPTAVQAAVAVATDGYAGFNWFPFDVCTFTDVNGVPRIAVIYAGTSTRASGAIQVLNITASGVVSAIVQVDTTVPPATSAHGAASIVVSTDGTATAWVAWSDGTTVRAARATNLGTAGQSNFVVGSVDTANAVVLAQGSPTNSTVQMFYEVSAAASYNEQTRIVTLSSTGGAPTAGAITTLRSVGLASKPWTYGGKVFVNTSYSSTLQATDFTWYIPSSGSPVIVSKMTPGVGGGLQTNGMCPETPQISAGVYKFANLVAGKIISEASTLFTLLGVNSTKIVHSPTDNFINATQANTLLIVGGILQGYDGVAVTEVGFHLYPENITLSASGSGSGLGTGTYWYVVQWEWTDNNGQIHRSAPSVAQSIAVTAGQNVTVSGPTLRLTNKTKVSIVIYRSLVNGSNPPLYYRVTSTLAPKLNDPTTDSWSFVDTLSDASAAADELNYTTGGILSNVAPPANAFLTTYGNRVFLGGLSDKLLSWYSQTTVDNSNANTVPPQFCQELTISCDPRGGDVTAFGVVNQTFVFFKSRQMFGISGNGPDAGGNNNDYGDPSLISSDVGCINPNSVVSTAEGLFFQSEAGIYVLDPSLNTDYIGAPVEAFNSLNITSSLQNAADHQIIFCSSNGTWLVYDYYFKQWSTWTNLPAQDAVVYNGNIVWVRSDGRVFQQDRTSFTDAGSPIFLSWTLPNLSFAGIQGYQRAFRCFILGAFKGPHNLVVNVAYDYNDSYSASATIQPQTPSTWGSDPAWGWSSPWGGNYQLYEYRVDFKVQKCTAIRLEVSDSQTSNYNEGYAISSVVFEVGALPGGNRLPATQVYGAK